MTPPGSDPPKRDQQWVEQEFDVFICLIYNFTVVNKTNNNLL